MMFNESDGTIESEVDEVVEIEEEEAEEVTPEPVKVKKAETLEEKEARLSRQLEQTRKKLGKEVTTPKTEGLDYGEKAFLKTNGIEGAKEYEFVQKELRESGLELDALLENGYFKEKLTTFRAINKTAEATPTSKRSGGVATDSVEYWASKPIEEVPQEMRINVVNYKLEKEKTKGMFYNS